MLPNAVPAQPPKICVRRTARWVLRIAPRKGAVECRQRVLLLVKPYLEKKCPAVCAETHSEAPFVQWLHSLGRAAAHQAGPHRAHLAHRGRRPHDLCAAVCRLRCSAPRRPSPSAASAEQGLEAIDCSGGGRRWRHVPCVSEPDQRSRCWDPSPFCACRRVLWLGVASHARLYPFRPRA